MVELTADPPLRFPFFGIRAPEGLQSIVRSHPEEDRRASWDRDGRDLRAVRLFRLKSIRNGPIFYSPVEAIHELMILVRTAE